MIQAEVAVTIRRPRPDVAAVMLNPRYDAGWLGKAGSMRPLPFRSLRQGDKVQRDFRLFAYRVRALCDVVAHVPGRCLEMAAPPPTRLRIRYEFEGIPEGTIVRVLAQSVPPRWLHWLEPLLSRLLRQAVRRDLGRLKALVESDAWRSFVG
jgi:hypothetical protein